MTEKSFIRADAVAEELDVSKSYAYKVIKQLNDCLLYTSGGALC